MVFSAHTTCKQVIFLDLQQRLRGHLSCGLWGLVNKTLYQPFWKVSGFQCVGTTNESESDTSTTSTLPRHFEDPDLAIQLGLQHLAWQGLGERLQVEAQRQHLKPPAVCAWNLGNSRLLDLPEWIHRLCCPGHEESLNGPLPQQSPQLKTRSALFTFARCPEEACFQRKNRRSGHLLKQHPN